MHVFSSRLSLFICLSLLGLLSGRVMALEAVRVVSTHGAAFIEGDSGRLWPAEPGLTTAAGDYLVVGDQPGDRLVVSVPDQSLPVLVLGPGSRLLHMADGVVLQQGALVSEQLPAWPVLASVLGKTLEMKAKTRWLQVTKQGAVHMHAVLPAWFKESQPREARVSLRLGPGGQGGHCRLRRCDITSVIRDGIERTTCLWTFVNESSFQGEGQLRVILPEHASVGDFAMWQGDRLVQAAVVDRTKARDVFNEIQDEGRDPALLEWIAANLFTMRVFPVPARGEKKVQLIYTRPLQRRHGQWLWRMPLVQGAESHLPPERISVRLQLSGEQPWLWDGPHLGDGAVLISDDGTQAGSVPERSWVVQNSWPQVMPSCFLRAPAGEEEGKAKGAGQATTTSSWYKAEAKSKVLGLVQVPAPVRAQMPWRQPVDAKGKRILILCDRSGSMANHDQVLAQRLRLFLSSLSAADRVCCYFLADKLEAVCGEWTPAAQAQAATLQAINKQPALGWTDFRLLHKELPAAMAAADLVVLCSDGHANANAQTVEECRASLLALAEKRQGTTSYMALPVGPAPERRLLQAFVGQQGFVAGGESDAALVADLLTGMSAALDRDMNVQYQLAAGVAVVDAPASVAVGAALQVVLAIEATALGGQKPAVVMTFTDADMAPVSIAMPTADLTATETSFIPRQWAQRRIAELLRGERDAAVQAEVSALGRQYHVLTPYTSFLVLEEERDYHRFGIDRGRVRADGEHFFNTAAGSVTTSEVLLTRARSRHFLDAWRSATIAVVRSHGRWRQLTVSDPHGWRPGFSSAGGGAGIGGFALFGGEIHDSDESGSPTAHSTAGALGELLLDDKPGWWLVEDEDEEHSGRGLIRDALAEVRAGSRLRQLAAPIDHALRWEQEENFLVDSPLAELRRGLVAVDAVQQGAKRVADLLAATPVSHRQRLASLLQKNDWRLKLKNLPPDKGLRLRWRDADSKKVMKEVTIALDGQDWVCHSRRAGEVERLQIAVDGRFITRGHFNPLYTFEQELRVPITAARHGDLLTADWLPSEPVDRVRLQMVTKAEVTTVEVFAELDDQVTWRAVFDAAGRLLRVQGDAADEDLDIELESHDNQLSMAPSFKRLLWHHGEDERWIGEVEAVHMRAQHMLDEAKGQLVLHPDRSRQLSTVLAGGAATSADAQLWRLLRTEESQDLQAFKNGRVKLLQMVPAGLDAAHLGLLTALVLPATEAHVLAAKQYLKELSELAKRDLNQAQSLLELFVSGHYYDIEDDASLDAALQQCKKHCQWPDHSSDGSDEEEKDPDRLWQEAYLAAVSSYRLDKAGGLWQERPDLSRFWQPDATALRAARRRSLALVGDWKTLLQEAQHELEAHCPFDSDERDSIITDICRSHLHAGDLSGLAQTVQSWLQGTVGKRQLSLSEIHDYAIEFITWYYDSNRYRDVQINHIILPLFEAVVQRLERDPHSPSYWRLCWTLSVKEDLDSLQHPLFQTACLQRFLKLLRHRLPEDGYSWQQYLQQLERLHDHVDMQWRHACVASLMRQMDELSAVDIVLSFEYVWQLFATDDMPALATILQQLWQQLQGRDEAFAMLHDICRGPLAEAGGGQLVQDMRWWYLRQLRLPSQESEARQMLIEALYVLHQTVDTAEHLAVNPVLEWHAGGPTAAGHRALAQTLQELQRQLSVQRAVLPEELQPWLHFQERRLLTKHRIKDPQSAKSLVKELHAMDRRPVDRMPPVSSRLLFQNKLDVLLDMALLDPEADWQQSWMGFLRRGARREGPLLAFYRQSLWQACFSRDGLESCLQLLQQFPAGDGHSVWARLQAYVLAAMEQEDHAVRSLQNSASLGLSAEDLQAQWEWRRVSGAPALTVDSLPAAADTRWFEIVRRCVAQHRHDARIDRSLMQAVQLRAPAWMAALAHDDLRGERALDNLHKAWSGRLLLDEAVQLDFNTVDAKALTEGLEDLLRHIQDIRYLESWWRALDAHLVQHAEQAVAWRPLRLLLMGRLLDAGHDLDAAAYRAELAALSSKLPYKHFNFSYFVRDEMRDADRDRVAWLGQALLQALQLSQSPRSDLYNFSQLFWTYREALQDQDTRLALCAHFRAIAAKALPEHVGLLRQALPRFLSQLEQAGDKAAARQLLADLLQDAGEKAERCWVDELHFRAVVLDVEMHPKQAGLVERIEAVIDRAPVYLPLRQLCRLACRHMEQYRSNPEAVMALADRASARQQGMRTGVWGACLGGFTSNMTRQEASRRRAAALRCMVLYSKREPAQWRGSHWSNRLSSFSGFLDGFNSVDARQRLEICELVKSDMRLAQEQGRVFIEGWRELSDAINDHTSSDARRTFLAARFGQFFTGADIASATDQQCFLQLLLMSHWPRSWQGSGSIFPLRSLCRDLHKQNRLARVVPAAYRLELAERLSNQGLESAAAALVMDRQRPEQLGDDSLLRELCYRVQGPGAAEVLSRWWAWRRSSSINAGDLQERAHQHSAFARHADAVRLFRLSVTIDEASHLADSDEQQSWASSVLALGDPVAAARVLAISDPSYEEEIETIVDRIVEGLVDHEEHGPIAELRDSKVPLLQLAATWMLREANQEAAAQILLERVLASVPKGSPLAVYTLQCLLSLAEERDLEDQTARWTQRLITDHPGNAAAREALDMMFDETDQRDLAWRLARHLLELVTPRAEGARLYADICAAHHRAKEARPWLQLATRLEPEDPRGRIGLMRSYAQSKQWDLAHKHWQDIQAGRWGRRFDDALEAAKDSYQSWIKPQLSDR